MPYPLTLIEIQDGLSIYVPNPKLIKSTYDHLRTNDIKTQFPFWAKIWPSSKAMIAFLNAEPQWIRNKRILEIGAGIGLPSLWCAPQSTETIVSDHAPEAIELLRKNIDHLQLKNIRPVGADWNDHIIRMKADTILLSDINYDPKEFDSLISLIHEFLKQRATVIIATPERITTSAFIERLKPFIKKSTLLKVEEEYQSFNILILVLGLWIKKHKSPINWQ